MDQKDAGKEQQVYQKPQQKQDEQLPPHASTLRKENKDPVSNFPPQPHHTQAPSLSFKILQKSSMSTTYLIVDENHDATTHYKATPADSSSTMIIAKCPSNGTILANVVYHAIRSKIDVSFRDHTITLPIKWLTTETTYASDALQSASLQWRNKTGLKSSVLQCSNEKGVPLAKITTPLWHLKNKSDFDFFGEVSADPDVVDEMVATGLAMFYYVIRRRRNAGLVGAAGGAGA